MSGGNITYPRGKCFRNTLVNTDFRGYVDMHGNKHLLNTITGQDLIAGSASYALISAMSASKRVAGINLNDDYPVLGGIAYEYGFGIHIKAKEPGVGNDLPRGISKGYYAKTTRLADAVSGKISTAEMLTQIANVKALIAADTGLGDYDGNIQGAVIDVTENGLGMVATGGAITATFTCDSVSVTVTAAATVAAAVTAINAASSFYAKAHAFSLNGKLVIIPVDPSKAVTAATLTNIAAQGYPVLVVSTKTDYYKNYTYEVEAIDECAFFEYSVGGHFEHKGITSDDVFMAFANRKNNRGFANMTRNTQPADQSWEKWVLKTKLAGNSFHGASHNDTQEIIEEVYVPAGSYNLASFKWADASGSETTVQFKQLLDWWVA